MAARIEERKESADDGKTTITDEDYDMALVWAAQALELARDPLPTTAIGWLKYLYGRFQSSVVPSHTQRLGRALMQLLTTGSFEGADIFKKLHGEQKSPVIAVVPKFLSSVRISFGIGSIDRPASPENKFLYMRILASLVKRGFKFSDALPAHCSALTNLFTVEPSSDAVTPHTSFHWPAAESEIAQRFLATGRETMNTTERHAFIVIWAFGVLAQRAEHPPMNDLVGFLCILHEAGLSTMREFVDQAA